MREGQAARLSDGAACGDVTESLEANVITYYAAISAWEKAKLPGKAIELLAGCRKA